jgi:hypothetical protein
MAGWAAAGLNAGADGTTPPPIGCPVLGSNFCGAAIGCPVLGSNCEVCVCVMGDGGGGGEDEARGT